MSPTLAQTTPLLPAAVTVVTILLWATGRLPEYLVALLFFATALILRLAPPDVILSGVVSPAFWLVLSGFVLGAAIRAVGLADRIGALLAQHLMGSWARMVGGIVLLTFALAFVMPSNMGRITLLMPIVMALADRAGLAEGGRGRIGLVLAVGFGTYQLSCGILTANVPNLVMASAAERTFGLGFAYMPYLALHAPVLGVLKGVVLAVCVWRLFPDQPNAAGAIEAPPPWSADERRLGVILALTLALWMTDSLHGIQPAWVGLAAACVCLLPRVGFLDGDDFAASVNIRTCFYLAGILGLAAMVTTSGLGDRLGQALLLITPFDTAKPALDFASLVGLTSLFNFAVTSNGVPALFTPLAKTLASASGLPVPTVLMAQVIGYATPVLPYQAAPIVVAMGMGKVPGRDGVKLCLIVAAITFVVLAPLDYLWFRLLGWIG